MNPESKRQYKNFLIDHKFQIGYILFFVFYGMLAALGSLVIIGSFQKSLFDKIFVSDEAIQNPALLFSFIETLERIGIAISVFLFFYSLVGAFFGLLFSHRISGPIVALRRHIKNLKEGDYVSQIKLRKNDELKILEQELNELSDILKKLPKS